MFTCVQNTPINVIAAQLHELLQHRAPVFTAINTEQAAHVLQDSNAGLVRMPLEATEGKDVLLFSTPDNPGKSRIRMMVWASFDGAKTWPVKRLVHEKHSGYSSLAADKKGNIYCLFEREGTVSVARFNLEWLTQRQDWQKLLAD